MKPVRLVVAVVTRKIAVQPSNRVPVSNPGYHDQSCGDTDQAQQDVHEGECRCRHSENHGCLSFHRKDVLHVRHDNLFAGGELLVSADLQTKTV
jgi:hypothetical protein